MSPSLSQHTSHHGTSSTASRQWGSIPRLLLPTSPHLLEKDSLWIQACSLRRHTLLEEHCFHRTTPQQQGIAGFSPLFPTGKSHAGMATNVHMTPESQPATPALITFQGLLHGGAGLSPAEHLQPVSTLQGSASPNKQQP